MIELEERGWEPQLPAGRSASERGAGSRGSALTSISVRIELNLGHPAGAGDLLGVENPPAGVRSVM